MTWRVHLRRGKVVWPVILAVVAGIGAPVVPCIQQPVWAQSHRHSKRCINKLLLTWHHAAHHSNAFNLDEAAGLPSLVALPRGEHACTHCTNTPTSRNSPSLSDVITSGSTSTDCFCCSPLTSVCPSTGMICTQPQQFYTNMTLVEPHLVCVVDAIRGRAKHLSKRPLSKLSKPSTP